MKPETITTGRPVTVTVGNSLPVHDAQTLTEGNRKALIVLDDQTYTLHITKQGKLLLTK